MLYLLLVAAGAIMVALSWRRALLPVRAGLFLVVGYVLGTADLIAYGILRLYHYHPGLLADPMKDSYLGEILAEMLFVPAMVSALFSPGHSGAVIIWLGTAAVTGIQWAFESLQIFQSTGWRIWHTLLLFPGYLWAVNWWADRYASEGYTPLHRAVLILAAQGYTWHVWALATDRVFRLSSYMVTLIGDPEGNQVLVSTLLDGVPFMVVAFGMVWFRWHTRPALLLFVAAWAGYLYGLEGLGWRLAREVWAPLLEAAGNGLLIYGTGLLDRWFASQTNIKRAGAPV